MTYSTIHKLFYDDTDTNTNTKGVCPFIAYSVTEFESEFGGFIFWCFLFYRQI